MNHKAQSSVKVSMGPLVVRKETKESAAKRATTGMWGSHGKGW